MPLFECEQCHCVENTACGSYWGKDKKLCSECDAGEWHGLFPKRKASETNYIKNADGFLGPPGAGLIYE